MQADLGGEVVVRIAPLAFDERDVGLGAGDHAVGEGGGDLQVARAEFEGVRLGPRMDGRDEVVVLEVAREYATEDTRVLVHDGQAHLHVRRIAGVAIDGAEEDHETQRHQEHEEDVRPFGDLLPEVVHGHVEEHLHARASLTRTRINAKPIIDRTRPARASPADTGITASGSTSRTIMSR